jgi:cleavage stimulation factor subunit 3
MARQAGAGGSGSSTGGGLGRTETQQSLLSAKEPPQPSTGAPSAGTNAGKRPSSPPERKREDVRADYGPPHKRARPLSPPPSRERDRWEGPPRRGGARYGSPGWDRERDAPAPRRPEREEEKPPALPNVISWFVGLLPASGTFDGVSLDGTVLGRVH